LQVLEMFMPNACDALSVPARQEFLGQRPGWLREGRIWALRERLLSALPRR
jgi:hypothetical protein